MRRTVDMALLALTAIFIGGAASPCGHIAQQVRENVKTAERDLRMSSTLRDVRRARRWMSPAVRKMDAQILSLQQVLSKSLEHPVTKELTPEQEYYLGRTVCASVLADRYQNRVVAVRGEGRTATGSEDLHYLQAIAGALLPAAERSHLEEIGAERFPGALRVAVVPGETPNAFSTPGGFVMVSSGLLALAADEDELAAVLAHELAHVTLAHGLSAISRDDADVMKKIGRGAAALGKDLGKEMGVDLSELTKVFDRFTGAITAKLTRGYDADYEYAADARAETILAEAGYDPAALSRVISRLQTWLAEHGQVGFGKTHPAPADRLARLAEVRALPARANHLKIRQARFAAHTPRLVQQGAKLAVR